MKGKQVMAQTKVEKQRIKDGVCGRCGGVRDNENRQRCNACHALSITQTRIETGVCCRCGKEKENTKILHCNACNEIKQKNHLEMRRARTANNLCYGCDNPPIEGQTLCTTCASKQAERLKLRAEIRLADGLCIRCGKHPYLPIPRTEDIKNYVCEDCYFNQISRTGLKSSKFWKDVKALYYKQNRRCPYTGEELTIGINASLDHMYPKSRYPELRSDITNMEYICLDVNTMKRDRTPKEFLARIKQILDYTTLNPPHPTPTSLLELQYT